MYTYNSFNQVSEIEREHESILSNIIVLGKGFEAAGLVKKEE